MPDIEVRLRKVLDAAAPAPGSIPASARDCLGRAYEAAYAEDNLGALFMARAGLARATAAETETILSLYSVLIAVSQLAGRHEEADGYLRERVRVLREAGQDIQASVEADLGTLLFREATERDLPLLEAALEQLVEAKAPPAVLAGLRLAVAVARSRHGTKPQALKLLEQAVQGYAAGRRPDSLTGALMYLAHTYVMTDHPRRAIATADRLLSMPANRALLASMWLLKANLAAGSGEHDDQAHEWALTALELYAACGVRKGAVSAAVVVARLCAAADDGATSVLAWRVAVQQAERGEVHEELTLRLALGNQLLEAEEYELAREVLEKLLERQERANAGAPNIARTLMSLGPAPRHAGRSADALECWRHAVSEFNAATEYAEASRALLAIGTLLSRENRAADALVCLEAAVAAARKAADDDTVLPQALHALGHALCEAGDPAGLSQLDEAIRIAREYGARWYEADYSDTRAQALWALQRGQAAVAAALHAADLYAAADDPGSACNSELFAAHVLAETGQTSEAVTIFRMVLDQPEISRPLVVAANLGLAGALDELGRKRAPDRARRPAEEAADG
ncbi:hypothetical protein HER39_03325 [Arthrobacter deserti]|uniref:Tetratricopeptide repeat protein n=1 Tax=Arthrobacter deserti TaxID=1742687 RepID=A0ABX1JKI7_9MICC|nr:hypothetical protein [Arthrobacter deserti]